MLSPVHSFSGHTVLWLPPPLIGQLCPVHSLSRPHCPLAPSTSHSRSVLSILSPGHTVLWLPPHLIPAQPLSILSPGHAVLWLPPYLIAAQPCPFFLQVTRSSGSLHISFYLSPVHSFSRPHGPLAPSTSHSSSALSILSPSHTVLWLPPHLIPAQPLSILSPGHTVLWLPPYLIAAQPCPFFLQVTRSSGSLHISFYLSPVHSFSKSHGLLAPSTSHSSSALSILSPGHTVFWLPPHLIPAQSCPLFLQAIRSSGSLHISFQLSPVHSFSKSHGPLAPSTSHSGSALSILSPGHTVLWLPPHLIPAPPCPFFLQAIRSSGSLHISFQLSLSILSPGHTVLWLPPHLIQAQPCPFFLQATRSSGSLHISFKLSSVHSFSRPHGHLAPSTSHSSSALSILSSGHAVLWLPPHLIPAQPCPFFLQATRSSGFLYISFKLSPVHFFSRPHGPLAPSTSHSQEQLARIPVTLTISAVSFTALPTGQ